MPAAMRASLAAALAATLVATAAPAAEGMRFLAPMLEDAVGLTEAMLAMCTAAHPGLAERAAGVFAAWRERNAAHARRMTEWYERSLAQAHDTAEELAAARRKVAEAREDLLDRWRREVRREGEAICMKQIDAMTRPEGDLAAIASTLR